MRGVRLLLILSLLLCVFSQLRAEETQGPILASSGAGTTARPRKTTKQSPKQKEDAAAFMEARRRNSVEAYESYLEEFPRGAHADDARERIAEIKSQTIPSGDGEESIDRVVYEICYLDGLIERTQATLNKERRVLDKGGEMDDELVKKSLETINLAQEYIKICGEEYQRLAGKSFTSEVCRQVIVDSTDPDYFSRFQMSRRQDCDLALASAKKAADNAPPDSVPPPLSRPAKATKALEDLFGPRVGKISYSGRDFNTIRIDSPRAEKEWLGLVQVSHCADSLASLGYKKMIVCDGKSSWILEF